MKSSVSHFLAFTLMLTLSFVVVLFFSQKQLTQKQIIKNINTINYYENAYNNITNKVDDYIVNQEVKELYNKYITIDIIKDDVNIILNSIYSNKNVKVSRYDEFYKIINDYNDDKKIDEIYADGINEIYSQNIFPIKEFSLINKLYLDSNDSLFLIVVALGIVVLLSIALFIINRNFKYHRISILSTCVILIMPFVFLEGFGIFKDFLYTNKYYTDFILVIINNIKNYLAIFSILWAFTLLVFGIVNKKNK